MPVGAGVCLTDLVGGRAAVAGTFDKSIADFVNLAWVPLFNIGHRQRHGF
ncbi:hypothetical protein [Mycolicibacterium nivoides]